MFKEVKKVFLGLVLGVATLAMASCGNASPSASLKLTKDYANKDFASQGITEATLKYTNDGDTAGFDINGITERVRFAGINTPESTGQIEKWGKSASLFTKGKLESAKKIVVEGETTPPEREGTGGRYLAFVWYIPEDGNDFINLNLEVVENGFSDNNCGTEHEYYDYFEKAEKIAMEKKLHIHSDDNDPNFDETVESKTVKELTELNEKLDQQFVNVEAYIKAIDDKYMTIADEIDGKEYTYTVYLGYDAKPTYFRVGNRIRFAGRINSYNGQWQLSGIQWELGVNDKLELTSIVREGYKLYFQGNKKVGYSYDRITVESYTIKNGVATLKGTTGNASVANINIEIQFPTTSTKMYSKGSKLNVVVTNKKADLSYKEANIKLVLDNESDIVIK